jgi:hypothetical protein
MSGSLLACSYADGALFPTKYELIKDSEAIVLAQPIAKDGYVVDFEILEVLKGDFPAKQFRGSEMHNSCVEYSYSLELGAKLGPVLSRKLPKRYPRYVLFLDKWKEGEWKISTRAAYVMNEMIVDVETSTFLKAVKHFIHIDSMNDYEVEKSELKKLRRLASSGRDPKQYPKELIAWIDDHLNYPSPNKSYKDLLDLYSGVPQDEKRNVLWAFAWGKHPGRQQSISCVDDRRNVLLKPRQHASQVRDDYRRRFAKRDLCRQILKKLNPVGKAIRHCRFARNIDCVVWFDGINTPRSEFARKEGKQPWTTTEIQHYRIRFHCAPQRLRIRIHAHRVRKHLAIEMQAIHRDVVS